jgi:hypothetical protein
MGSAANASRLASRPNRYSRSLKITQNLGLPATVFEAGRDVNAALNLARLAASSEGAIALIVKSKDDGLLPKHRQAEHRLAVDEELSHGVETPKRAR